MRELSLFYKLFLINAQERKAVQLCPFVKSGLMHKSFQPHVRADGRGIDYSGLAQFDTAQAIEAHFERQHPYWEKAIQGMLDAGSTAGLQEAVNNADKIHLTQKRPELVAAARKFLSEHST